MPQDLLLLRTLVVLILGGLSTLLRPNSWNPLLAALAGVLLGGIVLLAETRLRKTQEQRILGGMLGLLAGLLAALLISLILSQAFPGASGAVPLTQIALLVSFGYLGLVLGGGKASRFSLPSTGAQTSSAETHLDQKLLDTSVIIDGRIADVAQTGFLEGTLLIPQFVLRELQMVADSSDSLRRARGRRGLDVLQQVQKLPQLRVEIIEQDFPQIRDVDMKLIELARQLSCKIVTNDFNLNKIAQLQHVPVLNINELANALKPVVLPGEIMRVFILKEGKEHSQGVAYLDDGTMVVVDNARKMISKTIDISVTSVLQTTAGKMIFGKFDDRIHPIHPKIPATVESVERASRESAST